MFLRTRALHFAFCESWLDMRFVKVDDDDGDNIGAHIPVLPEWA
jgi:hypothetical protein